MMFSRSMRLWWALGLVMAQDLFEKEQQFLAPRGSAMQTAPALSSVYMPDCRYQVPSKDFDWPMFNSSEELHRSRWRHYFTKVYGEIPSVGYPICLGSFTLIPMRAADSFEDLKHITQHNMKSCVDDKHKPGTWVDTLMAPECSLPDGVASYIYNPYNLKHVVPNNMWVEVQHVTMSGDRNMAWYYLTFGSAVWFNVGKTASFKDHPDVSKYFLNTECHDSGHPNPKYEHTECEKDFNDWARVALKQGYTSIQITEHYDCQCGEHGHSSWDAHDKLCPTEIIDFHGHGSDAGCASSGYRTGWAAQQVCDCDKSKIYANCMGYGI